MNQKFALRTGTTKQDNFCKQRYVASTIIFYSLRPKLLYIAKVMYLGKNKMKSNLGRREYYTNMKYPKWFFLRTYQSFLVSNSTTSV